MLLHYKCTNGMILPRASIEGIQLDSKHATRALRLKGPYLGQRSPPENCALAGTLQRLRKDAILRRDMFSSFPHAAFVVHAACSARRCRRKIASGGGVVTVASPESWSMKARWGQSRDVFKTPYQPIILYIAVSLRSSCCGMVWARYEFAFNPSSAQITVGYPLRHGVDLIHTVILSVLSLRQSVVQTLYCNVGCSPCWLTAASLESLGMCPMKSNCDEFKCREAPPAG